MRGEAISDVLFEWPNNPLSLADDTLYYNTNLGAVVALRASDGQVRWLCRYRRSGLSDDESSVVDRHFFRDVSPVPGGSRNAVRRGRRLRSRVCLGRRLRHGSVEHDCRDGDRCRTLIGSRARPVGGERRLPVLD